MRTEISLNYRKLANTTFQNTIRSERLRRQNQVEERNRQGETLTALHRKTLRKCVRYQTNTTSQKLT